MFHQLLLALSALLIVLPDSNSYAAIVVVIDVSLPAFLMLMMMLSGLGIFAAWARCLKRAGPK